MTDKVKKIREELARLKEETSIGLSEHENGVEQGRMEIINALSIFIDSMQEEPKDKCKGCNNVKGCITCVDGSEWAHYEEPVKS